MFLQGTSDIMSTEDLMTDEAKTGLHPVDEMPAQRDLTGSSRPPRLLNYGKAAQKRLKELGFDPIEKMVAMHEEVDIEIANLLYDDEGNKNKKYSGMALATLLSTKQKIIADLLRYGYARVSETPTDAEKVISPIQINLTSNATEFGVKRFSIDSDAPMKGSDE